MDWLVNIAQEYGLFVALVIYVLYENKRREERYIQIIETLSDEIKVDLAAIMQKIEAGDK
jgi:hypothetical protein